MSSQLPLHVVGSGMAPLANQSQPRSPPSLSQFWGGGRYCRLVSSALSPSLWVENVLGEVRRAWSVVAGTVTRLPANKVGGDGGKTWNLPKFDRAPE